MRKILIIGCGDIACRTIPLLTKRYRVFALARNPSYFEKLRQLGAAPIWGDLDNRASLLRISGLAEAILYYAPPKNEGTRDVRMLNFLSALSRRLGASMPKRLVYISTSGVYGDCAGARVSEIHPLNAKNPRALRRIDAERQVRAWATRCGANVNILRVPGIYADDRLPLSRLRSSVPSIVDAEDSYTNHIHADDLAHISVAAFRHGKPCRLYHACDDSSLKMGEYFDLVADTYNLPHVPRVSRDDAQRLVSPMMFSFMRESRRLTNQRLKCELKVKLMYPTVEKMLNVLKPSCF